ncbi:hypothetical protein C8R44DRAFT_750315 [Mycena epipterygia]|nr:hypothetical protein C8R44DRAFT_750315 [Mycena epipterygia]
MGMRDEASPGVSAQAARSGWEPTGLLRQQGPNTLRTHSRKRAHTQTCETLGAGSRYSGASGGGGASWGKAWMRIEERADEGRAEGIQGGTTTGNSGNTGEARADGKKMQAAQGRRTVGCFGRREDFLPAIQSGYALAPAKRTEEAGADGVVAIQDRWYHGAGGGESGPGPRSPESQAAPHKPLSSRRSGAPRHSWSTEYVFNAKTTSRSKKTRMRIGCICNNIHASAIRAGIPINVLQQGPLNQPKLFDLNIEHTYKPRGERQFGADNKPGVQSRGAATQAAESEACRVELRKSGFRTTLEESIVWGDNESARDSLNGVHCSVEGTNLDQGEK